MKKRIVKKYHLKESVKGCMMLLWIGSIIIGTLFYQSVKVDQEKQEKEDQLVVSVKLNK